MRLKTLIRLAALLERGALADLLRQYAAWYAGQDLAALSEATDFVAWAVAEESLRRDVQEVGRRHTRREYEIIEEMIRLLAELHGEIDDLELILQRAAEAERIVGLAEAANVADYLEASIHREFTFRADGLLEKGIVTRDERIALSGFIGQALGRFSELLDAEIQDLRTRSYPTNDWGEPAPVTTDADVIQSGTGGLFTEDDLRQAVARAAAASVGAGTTTAPVGESARGLVELVERAVAAPALSESGNLSGVVIVEGRSANGNVYTREALESGPAVFAGRPIYADHPTRSEEADRPERSIRDLVGRLPTNPADLWVDVVESGPHAGKYALQYRNGKLSETAGWLATLIREEIAGDQSVNAFGRGHPDMQSEDFVVEAFERAISLDFVTSAAAGGRATLVESAPGTTQKNTEDTPGQPSWIESLTVESLAEARPDIIDNIAQRERRKAYGEKQELAELQEANRVMSDKLKQARESARKAIRDKRKLQADQIVKEGLAVLPESVRPQVRRLVEADVQRFVEQVEVPTIDLPGDVQALPEEAQAAWLKAYMESLGTGNGEEASAHAAWTAVLSSWEKNEAGEWQPKAGPEEPLDPLAMVSPEGGAPMTVEALRQSVSEAVGDFRKALAAAAGPGVSGVTKPDPQATQGADDEARVERYRRAGLTEAEAKIAVRGRN